MDGQFNKLQHNVYNNNENYTVEYSDNDSDICVIYFSSHGMYVNNNVEEFTNDILVKNKYEWYRSRIAVAKKHIFLRDIYKQWYVRGINKDINCLDEIYKLLLKETEGYKVITIGLSAGGYAAILLGIMLNAKYILSFSPQLNFKYLYENKINSIPLIEEYKNDSQRNKYYDIIPWIQKSDIPIIYFTPIYNKEDSYYYHLIKDFKNVFCFTFKTSMHGTAMYSFNTKYIINRNIDELLELQRFFSDKKIDRNIFAFKCYGILNGSIRIFKMIQKKINEKLLKLSTS